MRHAAEEADDKGVGSDQMPHTLPPMPSLAAQYIFKINNGTCSGCTRQIESTATNVTFQGLVQETQYNVTVVGVKPNGKLAGGGNWITFRTPKGSFLLASPPPPSPPPPPLPPSPPPPQPSPSPPPPKPSPSPPPPKPVGPRLISARAIGTTAAEVEAEPPPGVVFAQVRGFRSGSAEDTLLGLPACMQHVHTS